MSKILILKNKSAVPKNFLFVLINTIDFIGIEKSFYLLVVSSSANVDAADNGESVASWSVLSL